MKANLYVVTEITAAREIAYLVKTFDREEACRIAQTAADKTPENIVDMAVYRGVKVDSEAADPAGYAFGEMVASGTDADWDEDIRFEAEVIA